MVATDSDCSHKNCLVAAGDEKGRQDPREGSCVVQNKVQKAWVQGRQGQLGEGRAWTPRKSGLCGSPHSCPPAFTVMRMPPLQF